MLRDDLRHPGFKPVSAPQQLLEIQCRLSPFAVAVPVSPERIAGRIGPKAEFRCRELATVGPLKCAGSGN
jgi:hypothetical protein